MVVSNPGKSYGFFSLLSQLIEKSRGFLRIALLSHSSQGGSYNGESITSRKLTFLKSSSKVAIFLIP